MDITNLEETKVFLNDIYKLFNTVDEEKRKLEEEIKIKDDESIDYLHELELAPLNSVEQMKLAKNLKKSRKDRRKLKDKLDVVKTLKGYSDKFIIKGVIAETKQVIENLNTLEKHLETRKYLPRVVKDLKCAKKG